MPDPTTRPLDIPAVIKALSDVPPERQPFVGKMVVMLTLPALVVGLVSALVCLGLVEDTRGNHPQAEAASQLDGVRKSLLSWTAKPRLYLVEKTLFFVSNRRSHFWTAWCAYW